MKKCAFCVEQIQAEAIKCRYCGEFLDGSGRPVRRPRSKKCHFATPTVVIALLCIGPLALPFVWFNPRYKIVTGAAVSVLVLVFTTHELRAARVRTWDGRVLPSGGDHRDEAGMAVEPAKVVGGIRILRGVRAGARSP